MAEKIPLDLPTRRTVEALLRELLKKPTGCNHEEEYKRLCGERDALRDKLLGDATYKRLDALVGAAWNAMHKQDLLRREQVAKVRRLYQSCGLTPAVRKEIDKLVAAVNREG